MKRIQRHELFRHLSAFLEAKGIELKEGSYVDRVRQGCELLTEVVNGTQTAVKQTRARVDDGLERLRSKIHAMTAPPSPGPTAGPGKARGRKPGRVRPRARTARG